MASHVIWKSKYPPPADLIGAIAHMNVRGELVIDPDVIKYEAGQVVVQGTPVGGGAGVVQRVTVSLTAAQISALGSTFVEIVPAQGVGLVIVPIAACLEYKAGTQPFGLAAALNLSIGTSEPSSPLQSESISFNALFSQMAWFAYNRTVHLAEDSQNQPLMLACGDPIGGTGAILTVGVADGASLYQIGDAGTIGPPGAGGTYQVSAVNNGFAITAAVIIAQTFTIAGDHAAAFSPGDTVQVYGSTGNDGTYTVDTAVFGSGVTVITVIEAVLSAVADGALGNFTTGPVGVVTGVVFTAGGTGYPVGALSTLATTGVGASLQILVFTATNVSDGTGRLTVWYGVMETL